MSHNRFLNLIIIHCFQNNQNSSILYPVLRLEINTSIYLLFNIT